MLLDLGPVGSESLIHLLLRNWREEWELVEYLQLRSQGKTRSRDATAYQMPRTAATPQAQSIKQTRAENTILSHPRAIWRVIRRIPVSPKSGVAAVRETRIELYKHKLRASAAATGW